MSANRKAIAQLEKERDEARQIVRDIYWMALRYADGRHTYAPGMCNDALRKAYDAGWLIHSHPTDPAFARDGSTLPADTVAVYVEISKGGDAHTSP